jgi:hypothetical protein
MKRRMGFVSNSSSSSFIIGFEGVDPNTVEIIKGLFNHTTTRVWCDDADDYVDSEDENSITLDIDNGVDVNEFLNMDFLKQVGCTTKWDY